MGGQHKNEEEITANMCEGGKPQTEQVRRAPQMVVAQSQVRKREAGKGKIRKIAGWSTKILEEDANRHSYEDTEETVQWRCISQECIAARLWKELRGNVELDVLEKKQRRDVVGSIYHSARNPFERFRGFWNFSRFELDFRRCEFFF